MEDQLQTLKTAVKGLLAGGSCWEGHAICRMAPARGCCRGRRRCVAPPESRAPSACRSCGSSPRSPARSAPAAASDTHDQVKTANYPTPLDPLDRDAGRWQTPQHYSSGASAGASGCCCKHEKRNVDSHLPGVAQVPHGGQQLPLARLPVGRAGHVRHVRAHPHADVDCTWKRTL